MALRQQLGFAAGEPAPALIIDTKLDHGLVPVTSLQRENGSLLPSLGRAVSKLSLEGPDGELTELPGVVYTDVGLGGGVKSHYELAPGQAGEIEWGEVDLATAVNGRQTTLVFDGSVDSLRVYGGEPTAVELGPATTAGRLEATPWGFRVGDVALEVQSMSVVSPGQSIDFNDLSLDGTSRVDGERVSSEFAVGMALADVAQHGTVGIKMRGRFGKLHGPSLGALNQRLEDTEAGGAPAAMLGEIDRELKQLLAHGLEFGVEELDIALPDGTMAADLALTLAETELDEFTWTGLLLALEARSDIRIPADLFDRLAAGNPNARSAVAMGFLQRDGDDYVMRAEYAKGLLTVNGAPMPIPMPAM
jgi:uncharacterized protein YdgA (DUF945 family)